MINFTPVARRALMRYVTQMKRASDDVRGVQLRVLDYLTGRMARTQRGQQLGIRSGMTYAEFAQAVPAGGYEQIRPYVMRMVRGERDVLWPGVTRRFAQSSGTSDGKSKYIPVTDDSLKVNHYYGGAAVVGQYLHLNPESRMFAGKGFILGGSFANEVSDLPAGVRVGDLSAHLIEAVNPLVNLFRIPSKEVALMTDWAEKVPALVEASLKADVTNISGVPSWFMTVLRSVMKRAGVDNIHSVWPGLEVFFHGGVAFGPYRKEYESFTDVDRMHYMENYNASEGFFAVQTTAVGDGSMEMLLDAGVFYEFEDISKPGELMPAWDVKAGHTYSLHISAPNGLCRYALGDTVTVVSEVPLTIRIAGRTRHFINAFGEEVMVHNTDAALAEACAITGASVLNYTAAPIYAHDGKRGRHQWLIEWSVPPADVDKFAQVLDSCLQQQNSDYQAKRAGGIFLDRLSITQARPGLFDAWLASTGKLGGQRKVPRLSNDRTLMDSMLRFQYVIK
ncbi:MAG: GH3 auxin-responsive promoter family protein [Muribaculaceae bacterium]|nr:GH3 auxin-responsive promoter family protein [Muribaculaceae bacterium]